MPESTGDQINLFDLNPPAEKLKAGSGTSSDKSRALQFKPEPPIKEYPNLDELKADAIGCQRCPLAATRTNVVVERGSREAIIMIIGEAPGESEDEQGLPFVGRSGQLLDKILTSAEFDLEKDVYICNINKCRPPGNRVPTNEEVAACKPYLMEQIRLVDPKIILLTGATALKAITGEKQGITKIRGKWLEWEGRLAMAILHPAYLLRNPSREEGSPKWLMWQDIKAIRAKYLEIKESREIKGE